MFNPLRLPSRTSLADTLLAKSNGLQVERLEGITIRLLQGTPPADFPNKVGEIAELGGAEVWCLRPAEWLAFGEPDDNLSEPNGMVCHDISEALLSIAISGTHAAELLQAGISVPHDELAGRRFVRTLCGSVPVYLRRSGSDSFRLHFDISLADHYWRWLKWTMQ